MRKRSLVLSLSVLTLGVCFFLQPVESGAIYSRPSQPASLDLERKVLGMPNAVQMGGHVWRHRPDDEYGRVNHAGVHDEWPLVELLRKPHALSVEPGASQILAVQNSSVHVTFFQPSRPLAGLSTNLEEARQKLEAMLQQRSEQMFFTALPLAFALLHLILFLYSPATKANLYYALFLFVSAAGIFVDIQSDLMANNAEALRYLRVHRFLGPVGVLLFLRFVYAIFFEKCPGQFWIFTSILIGVGILIVLKPQTHYHYFVVCSLFAHMEVSRIIIQAIRKKTDGAWIFATGILILFLFGSYDALLDLGLMAPINQITNAYYFGSIGLFVAMSVYLARDFARTNQRLLVQERRITEQEFARKLIEADNRRKTRELEEARQLQLSMLPNEIPHLPDLEIGVYMNTATEVGGDYYDFNQTSDGTLHIAIGDATGHGTRAGLMVATIKSLFSALGCNLMIPDFFNRCTEIIKQMQIGNLFMSLSLLRIKGRRIIASSAGMPPMLIFRNESQKIEEVIMKSMPLGAHNHFPYEVSEIELAAGDVILLMTDGFQELFNEKREVLDYPKVKSLFREVAHKSPDEIIAHLKDAGEKWRNNRPQNDDITFVVLKVREA
ncbi:MAG: PP2C family protein-serine/threonine phosphatase [bacterium]